MKTNQTITLPIAAQEYDAFSEQVMRRTVEQSIAALRNDITATRDGEYAPASLAHKRHQFLLMGG